MPFRLKSRISRRRRPLEYNDTILEIQDGDTKRIEMSVDIAGVSPDDLSSYKFFIAAKLSLFGEMVALFSLESPDPAIDVSQAATGKVYFTIAPTLYSDISPVPGRTPIFMTMGIITPGGARITLRAGYLVIQPSP